MRVPTTYGCVSFGTKEEHDMAVKLGNCIEVGRKKLVCSAKIFPTLQHHRALFWGEDAMVPVSGNIKPHIAATQG
eukprot:CAMPEP_0118639296 /NCGR_PEP_ID=MMETSP0785-20121206/4144_1 /TAXON_ID=91992 /ORGANISM="Bolidomonas pacifica, Strain CCMP 1866" /LENGTH=74 /DNA_ID=CAMNT_0006530607 /DNA_START=533 /DNA_END=753 /DNA_ORIENTATION=-